MSYSTNAAGVSKYTAERHQRILLDLLQQPGNVARKSVNLDAWTKEQIESVKTIGNINANAKWNPNEARHPPPTNLEESERDSEMEKYIRAKYETKRFMDRNPPSKVQTSTTSNSNPYASASTSATPVSTSAASPSTARPPKPEPVDPSQTVKLGFGRESRVEFSLGGGGVDIFDEIVQHKKPPPRSRTAPIPEPPKEVPPPTPAVPTPTSSTLSAAFPSRSLSAQPPGAVGASTLGGMGTSGMSMGAGMTTAVPANPVWGDMMALQTGGPLATQTPTQAPPMTVNNPYASLGVSASLPSTLANRLNQTRSFTAPVNAGMGLGTPSTGGAPPNPFFQQAAATGSSVLSSGSFGSGSMFSVPTGGSFGTTGSGMGVSPGGAFGGNPFGTSAGAGGSLGISTSGTFGTPVTTLQTSGFGASPSGFGTTVLSPPNATPTFSPPTQQPSPFQTNSLSPFGGATSSLGGSPNPGSLGAFGAAMSPGGQMSNSPFTQQGGASNSPYLQTNVPTGFQTGSSPFQTSGTTPFQQSTPSSNALFLQPNSTPSFPQSNSPYQNSNSPFPSSNSPYQVNSTFSSQTPQSFAPTSNNPFGAPNANLLNPFGPQQQQQFQAQFQGQGWGGM
ncbi:hypothetical protein FRC06_005955 [Ceratobasidium sp. 370]|nr:hypothetical protein FRC06_005955 [Ceratobasidium sp. 370]